MEERQHATPQNRHASPRSRNSLPLARDASPMHRWNYERGVTDCRRVESLSYASLQGSMLRAHEKTLQQGEGNVTGSYSRNFFNSKTAGFEADASPSSWNSPPRRWLASSPVAMEPVLHQNIYLRGTTDRKRAKSLALELSSLMREAYQESLELGEGREGGSPREAVFARMAAEFEASVNPVLHHEMISAAREESPLPGVTKQLSHAGSKSRSESPSELDMTRTFSDTISDSWSSGGPKDVENRQRHKERAKQKWYSPAASRSCCGCVCFDGDFSADSHTA